MREAQRAARVIGIERVEARLAHGPAHVGRRLRARLAAAADAPAFARHHLDERGLECARLEARNHFAHVREPMHHHERHREPRLEFERRLLDVGALLLRTHAAHGPVIEKFRRRVLAVHHPVGRAQRSLHHAARIAENDARAAGLAHERIEFRRLERGVIDPFRPHPVGQFTRRDHGIHVAEAGIVHLGAADLKLLGRAGRERNIENLRRIQPLALRKIRLDRRPLHADGTLRRRHVRQHLRVPCLAELHPRRTAARKLR